MALKEGSVDYEIWVNLGGFDGEYQSRSSRDLSYYTHKDGTKGRKRL